MIASLYIAIHGEFSLISSWTRAHRNETESKLQSFFLMLLLWVAYVAPSQFSAIWLADNK